MEQSDIKEVNQINQGFQDNQQSELTKCKDTGIICINTNDDLNSDEICDTVITANETEKDDERNSFVDCQINSEELQDEFNEVSDTNNIKMQNNQDTSLHEMKNTSKFKMKSQTNNDCMSHIENQSPDKIKDIDTTADDGVGSLADSDDLKMTADNSLNYDSPNIDTEVIMMYEQNSNIEEEGNEDCQEDVLAGSIFESDIANSLDVKSISKFVIDAKNEVHKIDSDNPITEISKESANNVAIASKKESNNVYDQDESATVHKFKGEDIDENQCRICLSKKDLINIFKIENRLTIADKIIAICAGVRIQRKDFLPQFICNTCMQSVQVAFNLKKLCETTDKDLRSKLSRSRKNMRRPTEYVLLDATKFDDSDDSIDELSDDDEFKISNDEIKSGSDPDSDDIVSDFGSKRRSRRGLTKKSKTHKKAKSCSKPMYIPVSASKTIPFDVKQNDAAANESSSESDPPPKKRQCRPSISKENHCTCCNEIFSSKNALLKHKKSHYGKKTMMCDLCGINFKIWSNYQAHLTKHEQDEDRLVCLKCDRTFQKLIDKRRHLIKEHNVTPETFPCGNCKRVFAFQSSLECHVEDSKCFGYKKTTSQPPRRLKSEAENLMLGRDLFKFVAPLTTTYWSDSFSD